MAKSVSNRTMEPFDTDIKSTRRSMCHLCDTKWLSNFFPRKFSVWHSSSELFYYKGNVWRKKEKRSLICSYFHAGLNISSHFSTPLPFLFLSLCYFSISNFGLRSLVSMIELQSTFFLSLRARDTILFIFGYFKGQCMYIFDALEFRFSPLCFGIKQNFESDFPFIRSSIYFSCCSVQKAIIST